MYPVSSWSCFAPDHHGYQRACGLISGQASIGPFGSPVFACAGKTEPPSLLILSQTSAGKGYRSGYVIADSSSHVLVFNGQTDWAVAIDPASKSRPRARTDRAMRASLLASAIASTLRCSRFLAASMGEEKPDPHSKNRWLACFFADAFLADFFADFSAIFLIVFLPVCFGAFFEADFLRLGIITNGGIMGSDTRPSAANGTARACFGRIES